MAFGKIKERTDRDMGQTSSWFRNANILSVRNVLVNGA
jgi:hypothetical protein